MSLLISKYRRKIPSSFPFGINRSNRTHRVNTLPLVKALTILIKPGRVPDPVRAELMKTLTGIPKRPGGVRDILEFVFAVHPSTTVKTSEAANPQKTGANITMEALKMASNILATPPAGTKPEDWFEAISGQLIELLDGAGDRDLVKVAAYVIGFGILGRRQFGAPGMCFDLVAIDEL